MSAQPATTSAVQRHSFVCPRAFLLATTCWLVFVGGCSSHTTPPAETPPPAPVAPAPAVAEEDFAATVHSLLMSKGHDREQKLLLAGVVQYQLERARELFEAGHEAAAEDVVTGALLLLRENDAIQSATDGRGQALLLAAHAAARMGDIGRSRALYERTLEVTKDPSVQRDVEDHLRAIAEWVKATRGPTELQRKGEHARAAVTRAVVDPRAKAYASARQEILDWMHAALETSIGEGRPASHMERDQALEAYRAIRSGAPALIALSLRQGDPQRAVKILEQEDLGRALPPGVGMRLRQAGEEDDPQAWLDLFRLFDATRRDESAETSLPAYVGDAGALWSAIGLFRSSPGSIEHAMPLSMMLVEFGMPEVGAALLAGNSSAQSPRQAVSWSVALILNAMMTLERTDQIQAARRTLEEAKPLLKLAESQFDGIKPPPSQVYALLAALETRRGFVDRAYPLLEKAAQEEPSSSVLMRLAKLARQRGDLELALSHLERSIQLARSHGDVLTEARAEELVFQIQWTRDNLEAAKQALDRALKRTLTARSMEVSIQSEAAVERLLARLLEHYGEPRASRRAYQRALEASRSNLAEVEITLTDMARSALTTGDVRLSRLATRSALDLGLPPEELIYIALWQKLVEKRTDTPSDGLSREVLAEAGKATGWLATLREFGRGELPASGLQDRAGTIVERTEANFYTALSDEKRKAMLAEVEKSPAVDLIEVQIAHDLLAERDDFELPEDVDLP